MNILGYIVSRIIYLNFKNLIKEYTVKVSVATDQAVQQQIRYSLLEKFKRKIEKRTLNLYIACVDLTEAFDKVSREGLYIILSKLRCPGKPLSMIKSFFDGEKARVIYEGSETIQFNVSNEVKQGMG